MGKPDATEEEVYEAARKARCYDFIMALPDGFQTVVGEGGATLSGGEKQRISIARCILKDAPIVILDEATSSVDPENQHILLTAINELTKGNDNFEIYDGFQPLNGELIFDKNVNSAFKDTGLLEYLRQKEENTIIIVGLQTDYCIDATIKSGFEHGFKMLVPANANSTVDNQYMTAEQSYHYYNEFMWNKRYAECIPFEKTLELMD